MSSALLIKEPAVLATDTWKKQALSSGKDLIDLSVGASDLPPPSEALGQLRVIKYMCFAIGA
jgi:hypothetical protein